MSRLEQIREQGDVVRAQLGDDEAFMRLAERYHSRLLHYVRRLAGDRATADDVVQEAWLAAYRGLRRLEEPARLKAWLYGIARNKALNALRREERSRLDYVSSNVLEDVPEDDDDALEIRAEQAAQVHRGLDEISPAHAEALILRYMEGLPYEEIAQVVGCSVGTVRSRLQYAKRALREAMESEER
ncbi:MAG: sigma-70 family RNA polymerase sigma factor [Armatimonadota bacterium]|nr:sigma-70 family RNA polymerase sigma factor [Armatimonadota bacterium]